MWTKNPRTELTSPCVHFPCYSAWSYLSQIDADIVTFVWRTWPASSGWRRFMYWADNLFSATVARRQRYQLPLPVFAVCLFVDQLTYYDSRRKSCPGPGTSVCTLRPLTSYTRMYVHPAGDQPEAERGLHLQGREQAGQRLQRITQPLHQVWVSPTFIERGLEQTPRFIPF
jgi:hypothetical protein